MYCTERRNLIIRCDQLSIMYFLAGSKAHYKSLKKLFRDKQG